MDINRIFQPFIFHESCEWSTNHIPLSTMNQWINHESTIVGSSFWIQYSCWEMGHGIFMVNQWEDYFGFCIQGSKGTISTKLASDDVAFFWRALCIKIPMTHPAYECLLISMLYSFGMSVAHRIWQPFITNNTMEYQWIHLNQFRNSSMKLGLWSYVDDQVNIKKMRIHSMHSDQLEEFTDNN